MAFGHRGVNQPVRDLDSDRVVMTTQNHGYAVTEPGELDVTQINVNDDTPEGSKATISAFSPASTTPRRTPARTTRSTSSTKSSNSRAPRASRRPPTNFSL